MTLSEERRGTRGREVSTGDQPNDPDEAVKLNILDEDGANIQDR